MSKNQSAAGFEIRGDLIFINVRLFLIRDQDRRNICLLDRFSDGVNLKAMLLGHFLGLGTFIKTYDDISAAVLQIQGMCMALTAIAKNGNRFAVHQFPIRILIIVSFCHSTLSPHNVHRLYAHRAPAQSTRCG